MKKHNNLFRILWTMLPMALLPACSTTSSESPLTDAIQNYSTDLLTELQQAAAKCSAMEWCVVKHNEWGEEVAQLPAHRVSAEDMAALRHLILDKMHVVKFKPNLIHFSACPYFGAKHLRFLDADGNIIYDYQLFTMRSGFSFSRIQGIFKDSDKDEAIRHCNTAIFLPDADYETWEKLMPAKLEKEVERFSH